MQDQADRALLDRISAGGAAGWNAFVEACSDTVFGVVRLFADGYDDRMDLYLFVCSKLKENDLRRLRAFSFRAEAPCRFSTWLSVVVRNLAIDHLRSREGRFRAFRSVASLDGIDRWVFDYHLKDGLELSEVVRRLEHDHGVRVDEDALAESAGRLRRQLSASQRWRLLVRLSEKRRALPVDPVSGVAIRAGEPIPLADGRGDPERDLRRLEADRALRDAIDAVSPRHRLALALRFRDGLNAIEVAEVLHLDPAGADRLTREGLDRVRESLERSGFRAPDFEASSLGLLWPEEAA
jgi:RNA polymerase sigma factor (sigma-70 family)